MNTGPSRLHRMAAAAMFTLFTAGCEPDTGGRVVELDMALQAGPASATAKAGNAEETVTPAGWTVRLEEAWVAVGPVFVYENAPPIALAAGSSNAQPTSFAQTVSDWLIPPAYAHQGHSHFNGGNVRTEWLGQVVVNALEPNAKASLGPLSGVAGRARSLTVHLEPPRAGLSGEDELRGHHAYVVGVAEKDDVVVPFEGGLDIAAEDNQRLVRGVPVDGMIDDGVVLTIEVQPEAWLAEANFSRLLDKEPNEAGRYQIEEGDQVYGAWFIGIRSVGDNGAFVALIE